MAGNIDWIDYSLGDIWNLFDEGIYITDKDGYTLEVNHAYEVITGIRRDMVIGKNIDDIVREGILSTSITKKVIQTGKKVIERQLIMKTGKQVLLQGNPVFDRQGNISTVVTLVSDETTLNHMREEVERNEQLIRQYRNELKEMKGEQSYVAVNARFKAAMELAERVANVDTTVLIRGESGTGKEVIARHIYESGYRVKQPYIKINCGAIPESLLESELFGYEPGAFTGAKKTGHKGVFEAADKGTVFLDEIGDMPLLLQVKLLRVLQERTIRRVGSNTDIPVDVRIIAATNSNLEQLIQQKKFREDLYYRLNVVTISLPPLRERKDEIPSLVSFFTDRLNARYGFHKRLSTSVIRSFMEYDWPGNIRELENRVEQLMVTSDGDEVQLEEDKRKERAGNADVVEIIPLKSAVEHAERQMLMEAARRYRTTYEIAKALGISQASASRKLSKYRIQLR